jgi:hypothetical protein
MPSGNANYKAHANKPNTNAEGSLDTAADSGVNPENFENEGIGEIRASEAPENQAATRRENPDSDKE